MSKLRIGIVGAGGRGVEVFGSLLVTELADDTRITAIADTNPHRAKVACVWLRVDAARHENADDLCHRDDVDAVIVSSPDYLHEQHALAALEAGKHVLVDKPLATTVDGCLELIDTSRRTDRLLYMGFNLRHWAVVRRLKRMIGDGLLGDVFSIQAIEHYDGGRSYHSRWNRAMKFSGGLWLHKGSHGFDVVNYMLDPVRPVRVSCFASVFSLTAERLPFERRPGVEPGPTCGACAYADACPDRVAYLDPHPDSPAHRLFGPEAAAIDGYHKDTCIYLSEKDTHDQGIAIVEFANGATASHSEYFATPLTGRRYLVEGTKGHVETQQEGRIIYCPRWSSDVVETTLGPEKGGHGGADPRMVRDFLACIRDGRRPAAGTDRRHVGGGRRRRRRAIPRRETHGRDP